MEITLAYNPYTKSVSLTVQGADAFTTRLREYLQGGMEKWLDYSVASYHCWQGLLPEMIQEFNDDALDITFRGIREDYLRLQEAFENQAEGLSALGFAPDQWVLSWQEGFLPADVKRAIQKTVDECTDLTSPSQAVAEARAKCIKDMAGCEETVEAVEALRRRWIAVLRQAQLEDDNDKRRNIWGQTAAALEDVFR